MLSLIMQIVIWCILFANDLGSRWVLKQKPNSHNVTTIKLSLYSSYKKGFKLYNDKADCVRAHWLRA